MASITYNLPITAHWQHFRKTFTVEFPQNGSRLSRFGISSDPNWHPMCHRYSHLLYLLPFTTNTFAQPPNLPFFFLIIQICELQIQLPGPHACKCLFGTFYGELKSSSKPCPANLQLWLAKPVSVNQSAFTHGHYWTRYLAMEESEWTNDSTLLITSSCGWCDSLQYYRITLPRHFSSSQTHNMYNDSKIWLASFYGWWDERSLLWCHLEMNYCRIALKWKSWYYNSA